MRVAYTYVAQPNGTHRASPLARAALDRYAPDAEVYELGTHTDAYYALLLSLWADGVGFLNVEQDIELHASVLPDTAACPEPWCVWPYQGPGSDDGDRYLYGALGCTRFSTELLAAHPTLIRNLEVRGWMQLDCHILPTLIGLGYKQHLHWPAVLHHHVRENGRCDCRQEHE